MRRAGTNFGIDKDTSKSIVAGAAIEPEVRIWRFRKLVRTSGSRHERPLNSTRHERDNARNSVKDCSRLTMQQCVNHDAGVERQMSHKCGLRSVVSHLPSDVLIPSRVSGQIVIPGRGRDGYIQQFRTARRFRSSLAFALRLRLAGDAGHRADCVPLRAPGDYQND